MLDSGQEHGPHKHSNQIQVWWSSDSSSEMFCRWDEVSDVMLYDPEGDSWCWLER